MSENGENAYGVTFGRIMFLQRIIEGHDNIKSFARHHDLVFDVTRLRQGDTIQIVCVDEYVLSDAMARQIWRDFPKVGIIFVGGKWNHTSTPANDFCKSKSIAICNAGSLNAALLKTRYWT